MSVREEGSRKSREGQRDWEDQIPASADETTESTRRKSRRASRVPNMTSKEFLRSWNESISLDTRESYIGPTADCYLTTAVCRFHNEAETEPYLRRTGGWQSIFRSSVSRIESWQSFAVAPWPIIGRCRASCSVSWKRRSSPVASQSRNFEEKSRSWA